jgi:hypothetical protein
MLIVIHSAIVSTPILWVETRSGQEFGFSPKWHGGPLFFPMKATDKFQDLATYYLAKKELDFVASHVQRYVGVDWLGSFCILNPLKFATLHIGDVYFLPFSLGT